MEFVREAGVDVPTTFQRDVAGRQVLEFVPGHLALGSNPLTAAELSRVGGIVRGIHDAAAGWDPIIKEWDVAIPAPSPELICHNDLGPWNLIIGDRWTFIDWDGAGPSSRLWDLAYSAQAFTMSDPDQDPHEAAARLVAFVAGYGASEDLRLRLPTTLHSRAVAMHELLRSSNMTRREPWSSMFSAGHGQHWARVADYVGRNQAIWADALDRSQLSVEGQ